MSNLYSRLEIQDENDQAFLLSDRKENKGFTCAPKRFGNGSLVYRVGNHAGIKARIKNNKEVRAYLDCISQDGLVGMWHFDGDAKDDGPPKGRNNGTITGATYVDLDGEFALSFDGNDDEISVPFHSTLNFERTDTLKFIFTIKGSANGGEQYIFDRRTNDAALRGYAVLISGTSFNNTDIILRNQAGNVLRVRGSVNVLDGTKHKVEIRYDGSSLASGVTMLVDDVQDTSLTTVTDTLSANIANSTEPLHIGELGSGANRLASILKDLYFYQNNVLVALWRLDEGTGTTAYDSVTEKYDFTLFNAPTYTDSDYNEAIAFNGTDEYGTLADSEQCDITTSDFTISGIIYRTIDSGGSEAIIGKKTGITTFDFGYAIYINSSDKLVALIGDTGGVIQVASATSIELNTLYMFDAVYDRDGNLTLYINGAQDGTPQSISSMSASISNSRSLTIARNPTASNAFFGGRLDEFRFYERTLTATEISDKYASKIQHKRVFTGSQITIDEIGVTAETLQVTCRDLFKDAQLSNDVHKKYSDQEIATTVTDIIDRLNTLRSYGFDTSEIETLGQTLPFNFISENLEHAVTRITDSSFSELFMRPNKHIVLRKRQIVNSHVTLTDDMIRNPDSIQVTKSIADAYAIVRLVGGLSTEAYDLDVRIIAEARVPDASDEIAGRVLSLVDERFTTFYGAKSHVLTLLSDLGEEFYAFTSPLACHDLTKLPEPGELVRITSTKKDINQNFMLEGYEFTQRVGMATVNEVRFIIGKTEQGELETLYILQQIAEDEKRKSIDVDTATDQKFASFAVKHTGALTVTITKRDRTTTPYKWGDGAGGGANAFKWAFGAWHDGS